MSLSASFIIEDFGVFNLKNQSMARLNRILDQDIHLFLKDGLKGIEKESLRISRDGFIAQTSHPSTLGSALTHPHMTTDYSEALLELITPPFRNINDTLQFLQNIHQFFYDSVDKELLLAASMPCGINGDESIPIARFGSSNIGKMKHIYRVGLWHRYGRTMQAIAGIHFNYSVPEKLLATMHNEENSSKNLNAFISDAYFGLIRNFQRQGWLILYLFGASPAICKSFFKTRPHLMTDFEQFDQYTLFHPYATSLRMSDIGYKSSNQASLEINYNNLDGYLDSLTRAIETPYPDYAEIGVKVNGEYRQLNSNILQIENEYYSTVRPKQIARSCEKPTVALKKRGVQYVEIRSLDLDLFHPVGIDENKSRFIEVFLLTCLFQNSPTNSEEDQITYNNNQLAVAHQGRKPGLELQQGQKKIPLQEWAMEIIESMQTTCEILDYDNSDKPYTHALLQQKKRVQNPELTPSARILEGMTQSGQPFAPYALKISGEYEKLFRQNHLEPAETAKFNDLTEQSFVRQHEVESRDEMTFDQFLTRYFNQTLCRHTQ